VLGYTASPRPKRCKAAPTKNAQALEKTRKEVTPV
jgi:hypothetical protein